MRKYVLRSAVVLLLLSAFALTAHVCPARPETAMIVVPDDFPTIQQAINNATDGDTVFVENGTYFEHVMVNKSISLLGENGAKTVVDGNETGITIKVTRSGVSISNFTVQRSGSIYWESAGIFLDNVENCTINENILTTNPFAGLMLNHSHYCRASENRIHDNNGVGVTMVGSSFNTLSRNNITRNGWSALTLNEETHHNAICENSMISNNLAVTGHCINLYRSEYNLIQNNDITGDDNGIRLEYWSDYNTISNNNVTDNSQAGLSVEMYSTRNMIHQNTISRNGFGFYVTYSTQNTIWQNNIADNDKQANLSVGSVSNWDAGYPSGGNYWSDYNGTDLSGGLYQNETGSDGIGDTVCVIDANNIDRYPLKGMFFDHEATSECHVQTICNSTLSDFQFDGTAIRFNVFGESGTAGFCRVCIPTALMNQTYYVFVNGTEALFSFLTCSNATHSYIFFNYTHSVQEVAIVPELPSSLIPLLAITAMITAITANIRKPPTISERGQLHHR